MTVPRVATTATVTATAAAAATKAAPNTTREVVARKDAPETAVAPPPAAKPVAAGVALLERVDAETMLSRRFRVFRENLDEARGMNARQLRDLLDLFPAGWGQRRVLCMLFEQGIPGSVNKAIFLIEHLDSTLARRWCVKTLLGAWSLTSEERAALVERHEVFRVAAATR